MATVEFQERIKRINMASAQRQQGNAAATKTKARTRTQTRTRTGTSDGAASGQYFVPSGLGVGVGVLIAILNLGAVRSDSPWGPGTVIGEAVGLVGSTGVVLTLPMLLASVFMRKTKPGFFFFTMAYCIAVIASLFV